MALDPKRKLVTHRGIRVYFPNMQAIDPESMAMVQAMYSRTHESIEVRMPELFEPASEAESEKTAKLKNALSRYFLNYGHESIADCASITLFFEGLSQLAAKAIEDDQLFKGQETSTRYIDYTDRRPMTSGSVFVDRVASEWHGIYAKWLPIIQRKVQDQRRDELETAKSENVWRNACNAEAFDIMRGFLPCTSTTQVAWTGSLRDVRAGLLRMLSHPLDEISELARSTHNRLAYLYPSSFRVEDAEAEKYLKGTVAYREPLHSFANLDLEHATSTNAVNVIPMVSAMEVHACFSHFAQHRPQGSNYPNQLNGLCSVTAKGVLDFGSFRDLQRHRALNIPMPLLPIWTRFDGSFYVESVRALLADNPELLEDFEQQLDLACVAASNLAYAVDQGDVTAEVAQYAAPLMTPVQVQVSGPLTKFIYMLELRAKPTVHQTLRTLIDRWVQGTFASYALTLAAPPADLLRVPGLQTSDFLKRGTQTFVKDQ